MIKVSVIVPVYNVEEYLESCLDSLVNQTLQDIEIILIDDGSTDGSLEIIKRYHAAYPEKIVYRSVPNGGAASARNIALPLARGEYIGFADSDDYVDLTMYEKMYTLGIDADADIVTCGYNRVDIKGVQRRDVVNRKCFGHSVMQFPGLYANNVPYIWNKLFKRSLIEEQQAKFEPLRIFEDLLFTYKLFLKANRIVKVPETLYHYIYQREGSLTSVFSEKRFDLFEAFDLLLGHFKEEGFFHHFEEELLFLLLNHVFVVFDNPIKPKDFFLKVKFINKCFRYLKEQFPYWKVSSLYFEKRNKSRFLYTKKLYWLLKSLIPVSLRRALVSLKGFKRKLQFNRAGAAYLKVVKQKPVAENRVLINSQQGNNLCGNMFYILKALCTEKEYEGFDIALGYAEKQYNSYVRLLERYSLNKSNVKLVKMNSREYTEYLATAKYLFNDTSFSVYFIKREEQVYLNTWHGTPLKTLGKSTAEDYYDIANVQKNFLLADYLLYPSEYMRSCMFRDYMLEPLFRNKVLMAGYPRNEIFFAKERYASLRKELGMEGKNCIAYMPTWRGNVRKVDKAQKHDVAAYLRELDERLTEDQLVFVNLHPYVANDLSYDSFAHIRPFPEGYETYDFLNACDLLITDYSSVMFDYAVTGRKVILFAYDEAEYFENRGVYVSLDELPFPKVATVEELVQAINDPAPIDYTAFSERFAPYESGDITKRICAIVIGKQDAGLVCYDHSRNSHDAVMLHVNSLSGSALPAFKELCENTAPNGNTAFYYTYATGEIKNHPHVMKLLPQDMPYFGKLYPFSAVSLRENIMLYQSQKSRRRNSLFRKALEKVYLREKCRAFGYADFSAEIIIGRESTKTIGYVSAQKCRKIIYFTSCGEINHAVSPKVYDRFDRILVKHEAIAARLKQMGVQAEITVMQPKTLTDLM